MISDEFLSKIPSGRDNGIKYIIEYFFIFDDNTEEEVAHSQDLVKSFFLNDYLEFFTLLQSFLQKFDYEYTKPTLVIDKDDNILLIKKFYSNIYKEYEERLFDRTIENSKNRFDNLFNNIFSYEFEDNDLKRIQTLINELRENLTESKVFEEKHKARLLKRLESLQAELHKKMSNLDKFWGLLGDAGIALGKFGTDAKPFTDRIIEMTRIIGRTQAKGEGLPNDFELPQMSSDAVIVE